MLAFLLLLSFLCSIFQDWILHFLRAVSLDGTLCCMDAKQPLGGAEHKTMSFQFVLASKNATRSFLSSCRPHVDFHNSSQCFTHCADMVGQESEDYIQVAH
jgi:hypothetical protein